MSNNTTTSFPPGSSSPPSPKEAEIPLYLTIVVALCLCLMMLGLGASVSFGEIKTTMQRPRPLVAGVSIQYLLMPALAYSTIKILNSISSIDDVHALGLLLIGCCPGGTASNVLTYFGNGNMALGLSMTVVSNVTAVGTLPLLLYLYGKEFSRSIHVPYDQIAISLAITVVPVVVGIYTKTRSPTVAKKVERIGTSLGIILVVIGGLVTIFFSDNEFSDVPWPVYVGTIVLSVSGMSFGFLSSLFLGLDPPSRLTISLETGVQNASLAISIVTLTFDEPDRTLVLYTPIIYGLWTSIEGGIIVIVFRLYRHYFHPGGGSDKLAMMPGAEPQDQDGTEVLASEESSSAAIELTTTGGQIG